jgi:hypothetical protein
LIDFTESSRKSHAKSGSENGKTKPPLAASMCIGTSSPRPASSLSIASIPATSSQSPVNVVPTTATTPIVFSSICEAISSAPTV